MKAFGFTISREQRASPEDPRVPVSAADFLNYFGGDNGVVLPRITLEKSLTVPAFQSAVSFLSRTLAALPLHGYRDLGKNGAEKLSGPLQVMVHENPNPQMDRFKWAHYFWSQVFTYGRGLAYIERKARDPIALWLLPTYKTSVKRTGRNMELVYEYSGQKYAAADVIDIPFLLRPDMTGVYAPWFLAKGALQLSLAMQDYASRFFAGGGMPPLSLEGPLPAGADALKRAMEDIYRATEAARAADKPIFPMPPGYKLNQVGFDPDKGQMTDARLMQIREIARVFQLPPVFLQDLENATYSNVEQQDLHFVKHLITQWATALEGEMNLKLFGPSSNRRYVKHNLDGLLRGDFASRMSGLSAGVQNALLTPNEGRALENRPAKPGGDDLMIQGATVPIETQSPTGSTRKETPNAQ